MNRFFIFSGNPSHFKGIYLLIALNFICVTSLFAQITNRVNGTVRDSLNQAIQGANIQIISGEDTLNSVTDYHGKFNLSGIKSIQIFVSIKSMGYVTYTTEYVFDKDQRTLILEPTLLKDKNTLDEVVIKAQVVPIRLMKDTIEYNAAAYDVRETDRVEDLLRQLPGISIDNEGMVIAMGKVMTKLRINGEDFFTNNIKDFISQLPADMVNKLQVINDYGDEANFTGIKTGESQKMLNIITKPGRNKGNFGNTSINAGTNDRYGLQTNGNIWREKKQIGIKGNVSSTNNAGGVDRNISTGINYRDKLSEGLTGTVAYSFDNVKNKNHQLDRIESLNSLGTIYNTIDNNNTTNSDKHNLNWSLQSIGEKDYVQVGVVGSFLNSDNTYQSSSQQTGIIKQDLENNNTTSEYTPDFSASVAWAHRLEKPGRNISVGLSAKNGISEVNEGLDNHIGYYEPNADYLAKDSVLNRLVDTRNRSRNLGFNFRFSEPVGNRKDSLVSRNMDIYYTFALEANDNNLLTRVRNFAGDNRIIDSLSSIYTSSFYSHLIGVNYRYGSENLSYSLGLTAQPNLLRVKNEKPNSELNHFGFNVAPVANFSLILSQRTSLTFLYNGSSVAPNLTQLQPVPNTRNLQNVIIGNPNLESTFNHTANFTYQNSNLENGRAIMLGINGNFVHDQVVSNIVLKQDTLNSLKQETRFENASGAYSLDGLYSWSKPFAQNKYNIEFRGSLGFANNVSFTDNILNSNKGFNFSQALMMRMNQKGITLTADANYTYNSNRYSLAIGNLRDIQVYEFNINAKTFITRTFSIGLDASKRINKGYSLSAENSFLLNANIQKSFFKKQLATLRLQAYDLLNQGNSLIRSVSDNSITDSKNSQITRYFQLSFNINLQQFGG